MLLDRKYAWLSTTLTEQSQIHAFVLAPLCVQNECNCNKSLRSWLEERVSTTLLRSRVEIWPHREGSTPQWAGSATACGWSFPPQSAG